MEKDPQKFGLKFLVKPADEWLNEVKENTMKYILMILATIYMAACSTGGGGSSGSDSGPSPSSVTLPMPGPSPSPQPSPPPNPTPAPTCAAFLNTDWVPDGAPTLTPESQDQAGQPAYIAGFDMTQPNPTFIESQYSGFPGNYFTCTRTYSDGVPFGSPNSLVWSDTSGFCGALPNWIQLDTSQCNKLTVLIRDSQGGIYLTQDYKPN